jgi:hypothetical protein
MVEIRRGEMLSISPTPVSTVLFRNIAAFFNILNLREMKKHQAIGQP